MAAKNIGGRSRRLAGFAPQSHMRFSSRAATFAAVAGRAGCHQVIPCMTTAAMTRDNMVNREMGRFPPAVLAGEVIAAKDFALGEFNAWAWTPNIVPKADDRWGGVRDARCTYMAATIKNEFGFACDK